MKDEIVTSDEFEKLKEYINFLKSEVAKLTQEKHELEFEECPKIKAEFMEKIGDHTNNLVRLNLQISELKYRIMLAQAAINRAEELKREQIEEKVTKEYEEYHKKVEEQFREAKDAKEQARHHEKNAADQEERYKQRQEEKRAHADEPTEDNEQPADEFAGMNFKQKIKELYRRLVKKLHPDMNPELSERQKELWHKVQKAYQESDLETMEDIYDEINQVSAESLPETADGREKLLQMIERLERQIKDLTAAIEQIKSEFPYKEKEMLADEEKVATLRAAIEKVRVEYEATIEELTRKLEELLKKLNA